ncbi:VOC family protein [Roseococcus pinisoli]|uniref:VOC family protein n=1 Tax=Roseococcus pinisoli TaxID=2835040 RepID=A0ABS5Q7C2_9PROT|nr:VOC family protein [Roseococcus pinisoli]MBS7809549.1 VOC family protein [Roseococcus pinisoli]
MLDHVGIPVQDLGKSQAFYEAVLKPLRMRLVAGDGINYAGFGAGEHGVFWLGPSGKPPSRTHVAFAAEDREMVRRFHEAALEAGAMDNGGPGLRPHYHPDYYAAFVLDPDGHNIEAVCHKRM